MVGGAWLMQTNTMITVFNSYTDPTTRLSNWKATHVGPALWAAGKGAVVKTTGMSSADKVEGFIPMRNATGYVKPIEFGKDPQTGWTLRPGDKVVKGVVTFTGAISDLESTFDDVFTVTVADVNDYGSYALQHIAFSGQ